MLSPPGYILLINSAQVSMTVIAKLNQNVKCQVVTGSFRLFYFFSGFTDKE